MLLIGWLSARLESEEMDAVGDREPAVVAALAEMYLVGEWVEEVDEWDGYIYAGKMKRLFNC